MRELKALLFATTKEAYDATQTGEAPLGSVLLIPSEGVVGLAWTWPVAVTVASGELHQVADVFQADNIIAEAAWGKAQLETARDFALIGHMPLADWAVNALIDPLHFPRLEARRPPYTVLASATIGNFVKVRVLLDGPDLPKAENLTLEVLSVDAERLIGRISAPTLYASDHSLSRGDRVVCGHHHLFPAEEA